MASTARARLCQLQRRISFGLLHHRPQEQVQSSSSLLPNGHTIFHRRLPSFNLDSSWRPFSASTTTTTNPKHDDKKSWSDNEMLRMSQKVKMLILSLVRDLRVKFTHTVCGTQMERLICKTSYERGMVVARCIGCTKYVVIADHHRLFEGDSAVLEKFLVIRGVQVEQGSDKTVNYLFEFRDVPVRPPDLPTISVKWKEFLKFRPDGTVLFNENLKCDERNAHAVYNCGCGALLPRRISKKAYERGMVAIRCTGCKRIEVGADYHGWLKIPYGAEYAFVEKWACSKAGLVASCLLSCCDNELKEGSEDSLNLLITDVDPSKGIDIDWSGFIKD